MEKQIDSNTAWLEDLREQLKVGSEESLKKKLEAELTIICIKKTYFTKYLPIKIEEIQEVSNTFETTTTTNESLKQDSNTIENAGNDISEIGTNTSEQVSMNNW